MANVGVLTREPVAAARQSPWSSFSGTGAPPKPSAVQAASLGADQRTFSPTAVKTGAVPATLAPVETTLPVIVQEQTGNACGTTSLSMVLTYFGVPPAAAGVAAIDKRIRPVTKDGLIDSFTAPRDLVSYARRQDLQATLHNQSSPADLARMIDQGVPPIILYDGETPTGEGLHYVVVSGYRSGKDGRDWEITDPNGFKTHMSEAGLLKVWSDLHAMGHGVAYNRVMISIAPETGTLTTPTGKRIAASTVQLPNHNSPLGLDVAGTLANKGIRLVSKAYEASPWIAGKVKKHMGGFESGLRAKSAH
ncbi:MAG: C39 family peptidase [Candidatus Sericytochromatia bacterium]|nr:C39 family peptidase [Candidatus Sericytochromatia bacterium]